MPKTPIIASLGMQTAILCSVLPFDPIMPGEGVLRPEIQVEITLSKLRHPSINLELRSFVAEAFSRPPEVPGLACVSVCETVAEKFVALTRRTAVELADAPGKHDATLVRHIYDLHVTRPHYEPSEVAVLARNIIQQDAVAFGNQFPAYRDDPMSETFKGVSALGTDPEYATRYANFQHSMVYGKPVAFADGLDTLMELSELLR